MADAERTRYVLRPGLWVQIRNHFDERWSPGFVVDAVRADGCRVRRMRDDYVLPEAVPLQDVRPSPPQVTGPQDPLRR